MGAALPDDPPASDPSTITCPAAEIAVDQVLLERILREVPFGVAVLSAGDWRYAFANDAYRQLTGTEGCDLIGRSLPAVLPAGADLAVAMLARTVATCRRSTHRALQARPVPDAADIWCDLELIPLPGPAGFVASVLAVLRDVTSDVLVRAAQADSESTLDTLMRHIPEGITIADAPDVVTRRISAYGLAMTGRSADEVLGVDAEGNAGVWDILHPDGQRYAPDQLPLRRATVLGEVVIDEMLLLRRPDGRELALLCNAGPIRREDGSISGGVIAWRDVTTQHQATAALQQSEAALRDALAVRETLLEELNHRVMNSLQLVTGLLKMQERRMTEPQAAAALAEAGNRVHVIAGAYRHLHQAGHHSGGVGAVSLAPLLHHICAQIDGIRPGVTVRCAEIDPQLTLHADRAAPLGLMVNELLTNACKHAFPVGRSGRVVLDVAGQPNGSLEVLVSDDGIGFDAEAERSNGLGRSLLRSLVTQLGATLKVSSAPQAGSRTTISLPALS
jgi:PAS domain S-box-containing protein